MHCRRDWPIRDDFQGIDIDFENLYREDYARLVQWLKLLSNTLHPAGLQVSVDIEARGLRHTGETLLLHRTIQLCANEEYVRFPSSFVLRRTSYRPKWLELTFDDGPSEPYTAQILDTLKRFEVRATFFVIEGNAGRYPDLVRRIWDEGHEIGSHTFTHPNMGAVCLA